MKTVYITIGNSDDKLSQIQWASFVDNVNWEVESLAEEVHGRWSSFSTAPWQNACWCLVIKPDDITDLKRALRAIAGQYRQDSIAYVEVDEVEFLKP